MVKRGGKNRLSFVRTTWAIKNSAKILGEKIDFDPQEYLAKSLLFDLKKTSK